MPNFPTHPDAISTAWLADKLGASPATLKDFTATPIGTGQVADSYRLALIWADARDDMPSSIVIKCAAADETSRTTAKAMHLYEIEAQWYRHFAPAVPCRMPHAYYAEVSADTSDYILVLEDCAPAVQIPQMRGASKAQVQAALKEAAALHKAHWGDESLRTMAWLNYAQNNHGFVREFLPQVYPEWAARYQGRLTQDILDMGKALVAQYDAYSDKTRNHTAAPLVLAHGDLRLDNMLYYDEASNLPPVILDWQTVSAGTPMGDIAYCISTSFADPATRAACEEELVADYLRHIDAPDYSDTQAWEDYRYAAFAGFLMAVISAMLVERTPRGDEMFATMAERSAYQALHLDSLSLI